MDKIKNYILKYFSKSNLSVIDTRLSSLCHLRFELGKGLDNGSKERVDQCVDRAKIIFEEFFKPEDEIYILIKSFEYKGNVKDFFPTTQGYLESQIEDFDSLDILHSEIKEEEFDFALNNDGVMEMTDFTRTHIQRITRQFVENINYLKIFRAIANLEMGFEPAIAERIYFINKRNDVVFYIYDDRGCLLFAHECKTLEKTYVKHNNWLVDYHRETFDKLFQ